MRWRSDGFEVFTQPLDWPEDVHLPEILSAEERERCARLIRPADRARYAQSHVFLRETLSRFADVAPADWQFTRNEFGRIAIARPMIELGIDFNLSHTLDWAACVVTRGIPCGIDIELIRPIPRALDIARRHFAPEEFRELEDLVEDALQRRFLELWTEKEAWVKALGRGLSTPVNRIVVDIPRVILQRCHPTQNHAMVVVLLPTGLAPR
jgi:4'-phosphopantetheinyl transferase